jgi:hypothetical protein
MFENIYFPLKKINEKSIQTPQSLSAKFQFLKNNFLGSSGMEYFVVGYIIPNSLKDCNTFTFEIKQSKKKSMA